MAQVTSIEWTDATWNPVTGCTKVGPGCDHCYAERFAERWRGIPSHPYEQGFDLRLWPDRLEQPLSWRRPRLIFVNSMSDLFHKEIPHHFLDAVFDVMETADRHVYQILTKRSSLLRRYINRRYGPSGVPRHIWLGVSIENRAHLSRLRHLQETNVPARFISFEPLLGPIGSVDLTGIAWAIVGGESGPGYRKMEKQWAVDIRDACISQDVAFFFKQWGGPRPKSGGRVLDGEEWNGFPLHIVPEPLVSGQKANKFNWLVICGWFHLFSSWASA